MKIRSLVMPVFSVLMIILVIWFFNKHWESVKAVRFVNLNLIWILICLVGARITLRGLFHWQVMRSLGVDIPVGEALALNFAGTMMNQLLPMPVGPGYRAAYLKSKYSFPFTLFASTLAALFIYWLLVSTTLGLLSAIWYYYARDVGDWWIFAILGSATASCLIMFVIPKFFNVESNSDNWLGKRLSKILLGWKTIVGSKRLVAAASIVVVLSTIVSAAAMLIGFRIIDVDIEVAGSLLLMASQRIGSLIKLTPGAVGYQEMVGMYFANILEPTAAQAAVVFGLTRIVNTAIGVTLGLPSLWILSGRSNSTVDPINSQTADEAID